MYTGGIWDIVKGFVDMEKGTRPIISTGWELFKTGVSKVWDAFRVFPVTLKTIGLILKELGPFLWESIKLSLQMVETRFDIAWEYAKKGFFTAINFIKQTFAVLVDFMLGGISTLLSGIAGGLDWAGQDELAGKVNNAAKSLKMMATNEAEVKAEIEKENEERNNTINLLNKQLETQKEQKTALNENFKATVDQIVALGDVQKQLILNKEVEEDITEEKKEQNKVVTEAPTTASTPFIPGMTNVGKGLYSDVDDEGEERATNTSDDRATDIQTKREAELESLMNFLMTKEEIELESRARQEQTLKEAHKNGLLTDAQYYDARLKLEKKYTKESFASNKTSL